MTQTDQGIRAVIVAVCTFVLLLAVGCGAPTSSSPPVQPTIPRVAARGAGITTPIAAAWLYMADNYSKQAYNKPPPPSWSQIDFHAVDVLYVGPGGIQDNQGTFGLFNSASTGNLANLFNWVIKQARSQNPDIKIIISQWWESGSSQIWGKTLSSLKKSQVPAYAQSVAKFVQQYGIDGFDIDYESSNFTSNQAAIAQNVRQQLDAASKTMGKRLYQTVSPSGVWGLEGLSSDIDFVNMQTYEGGTGMKPWDFTQMGYSSSQLLYGYCPESQCRTPTLQQVEQQYTENKLAGIHLWRLNSENYIYENQQQAAISAFLFPNSPTPKPPSVGPTSGTSTPTAAGP